jgi:hypothetical protein
MLGFNRNIVIGVSAVVAVIVAILIYQYAIQPAPVATVPEPAPTQQVK